MGHHDISDDLSTVLQSLIRTSVSVTTVVGGESDGPKSPHPSRILRAVYFSKTFVPTYYIVVALIIVVASTRHALTRWARSRQLQRSRVMEKGSPQTLSSASSKLVEEETPAAKDGVPTERTSLLIHESTTNGGRTFLVRLYHRCRAWSMYQPRPIPAITASTNLLPSNTSSFLVIVLLLVNAFYLFFNLEWSVADVFVFGDRAGLCFMVNLPVLYVLGAKNNQPLKWLTGWSYEKLNLFHRRLGEWMVLLGVWHGIAMCITWYTLIRPQGYPLAWFLSEPIIIIGIAALVSFAILWATSIGYVRERAYELFLALHITLQTAALVLLFFHSKSSRPYCGAAIAIWALDRVASRTLASSRKFIATLEIAEDKTTVLLHCDIPLDRSKRGDIRSGWRAGQHVFVSVPGMKWHHAFQAHPFTIASPPPSAGIDGEKWPLQLIIRCKDGFSKELLEYTNFHQHAEVYIDGPYGSYELEDAVIDAERVCLIAGGSGIAITYPLAWVSWANGRDTTVVSNRVVYQQGKKLVPKVALRTPSSDQIQAHFWIRQSPKHSSWITMFPKHHISHLASGNISHCSSGVDLVSRAFETRQSNGGRPDIATEVRTWLKSGDTSILGHKERVCLIVSGPESLVRDVRNCAASLVRQGYNIDLHVEKFGW